MRKKYQDYLTVGRLKQELENYPDDALVVSQRVEDGYYEGWDISGMNSINGILPSGSKSNPWETIKKEQSNGGDDLHTVEYSPVWCVVHYKDDKEHLYLDLHY